MWCTYLDGLPHVGQRVADHLEQPVESDHLLHEHGVHALLVGRGELPQHGLRVKVLGQLAEDVSRHLVHHLVRRLATSRRGAGLEGRTGGSVTGMMGVGHSGRFFVVKTCHSERFFVVKTCHSERFFVVKTCHSERFFVVKTCHSGRFFVVKTCHSERFFVVKKLCVNIHSVLRITPLTL